MQPDRTDSAAWTPAAARAFLGEWRENGNASKARAHLAAALDELERLSAALRQLGNIMDYTDDAEFGCGNKCDGCHVEMVEASRIVSEALNG